MKKTLSKELTEAKSQVENLAHQINAPNDLLPTYNYSRDFAFPHIEYRDSAYHYVIIERGEELDHRTTLNLDELLYWIFQDVTFSMASSYSAVHSPSKEKFRFTLFEYQLGLLESLNINWKELRKKEIDKILEKHP